MKEDKESLTNLLSGTVSITAINKRVVWKILFDHETRTLTKIIKLQDTDLIYLCL